MISMSETKTVSVPFMKDAVLDCPIRCQRVKLLFIDDMSVRDLFSGFDRLHVITFSANADFNKLPDYRELREFNIRYLLEHGIA